MKHASLALCLAVLALTGCKDKAPPPATSETENIVAVTPPPGGNWADLVTETSEGGYRMGNPQAKVKLIEIASLSCPYCREFEEAAADKLVDTYVKSGNVSWEFRPFVIHGPVDMSANLIARCNGPKTFFPLVRAIYADQKAILARLQSAPRDKLAEIENAASPQPFVAMADLLDLRSWAAARGVSREQSTQCLSDQAKINAEVQMLTNTSAQFPDFAGTPSFVLDGKLLPRDQSTWAKLEPLLQSKM